MIAFLLNLSCHMAPVCNFPVRSTTSFNNLLQVLQLSLHQKSKNLWTLCYLFFFFNIKFLHHFIVLPICYFPRQDWEAFISQRWTAANISCHTLILSSWLTEVHQSNETESKRSDEDENTPPSPPTHQSNNGWLILFPRTMLNWLENIRSGNKTLWFKVNILPSDIENNCLS